jgi:hypothetical protein
MLRTVTITRYVTPLREGGSLPAIAEADDDGLYVVKFRGAGQGAKALIAELLAGELARAAGLPVPEIVFARLDADLARLEPDPEIQELIRASGGLNLGMDYLPGSVTFDPVTDRTDAALASRIVWFDAFVTNVDRSARNANMLLWHRALYLIDHGASFYASHSWDGAATRPDDPFPYIRDHILLHRAAALREADRELRPLLTSEAIERIVQTIPDDWLEWPGGPARQRQAYADWLHTRLEGPPAFLEEAIRARDRLV